jgi:hypothetical protein
MNDVTVLVCQYAESTATCAKGAIAYLIEHNQGTGWIHVLVYSRSQRWVQTEKDGGLLTDFRLKSLPGTHPLQTKNIHRVRCEDRSKVQALQELADFLQNQRDERTRRMALDAAIPRVELQLAR